MRRVDAPLPEVQESAAPQTFVFAGRGLSGPRPRQCPQEQVECAD
jgi:hypothetical protein